MWDLDVTQQQNTYFPTVRAEQDHLMTAASPATAPSLFGTKGTSAAAKGATTRHIIISNSERETGRMSLNERKRNTVEVDY